MSLNPDKSERVDSCRYFIAAAVLLCGLYLSELIHLLEQPLFSRVYYGNLNSIFFAGFSALYLGVFFIFFHKSARNVLGETPFKKKDAPMGIKRNAILYAMTVIPVVVTAMILGFEFKIVYELGENVSGMVLYSNVAMYANKAVKLLYSTYLIYLFEKGARKLFNGNAYIPFGGIMLLLTFGIVELLISVSEFRWLYFGYTVYFGLIYRVSEERFVPTYLLSLILFVV